MWEYQVVGWAAQNSHGGRSGPAGAASMLNEKGTEGWELVAVTPAAANSPAGHWWVFKRPRGDGDQGDQAGSAG